MKRLILSLVFLVTLVSCTQSSIHSCDWIEYYQTQVHG